MVAPSRSPLLAVALLTGCSSAWQPDFDRLQLRLETAISRQASTAGPSTDAALDQELAGELAPDRLMALALSRNAMTREAAAMARASLEQVGVASRLEDPVLRLRTEEIPVRQPVNAAGARMNAFGLEQRLPPPGLLAARGEAALRTAEAMEAVFREREREVAAMVRKAWAMYAERHQLLAIHREHVALLEEFERISNTKFRTGVAMQQDVLRPQVELVMLQAMIIDDERMLERARAEINRLLNRPTSAPLGRPAALPEPGATPAIEDTLAAAEAGRPELEAAHLRIRAAEAAATAAQREATWPEFMIGAEFMDMAMEDGLGGMLGVNLPWVTGRRAAEARMRDAELRAARIAIEDVRARVQFQVRDAWVGVEAARRSAALYRGELLPKSRQMVEVTRAGYEKDKASFLDLLDAERSLRDVRESHIRSLAAHVAAMADLEQAAGLDPRRTR